MQKCKNRYEFEPVWIRNISQINDGIFKTNCKRRHNKSVGSFLLVFAASLIRI